MSTASLMPIGSDQSLLEVLDAAVALTESDFGNIRLRDEDNRLKIAVHRGFPDWWIDYWDRKPQIVCDSCSAALARRERILVEDVLQSPIFVNTDDLDSIRKLGVRAVQSTPVVGRSGQILGILSTHYKRVHRPDAKTLKVVDALAMHAATLIERARAEQALQNAVSRYQTIFDSAPVGIVEVDPKSMTVVLANKTFCSMLGYSEHEVIGKHILNDLTWPDDRQLGLRASRQMAEGETDRYRPAKRYLHKDGNPVWAQLDASLLTDGQRPGDFIGVVTNLTHQRQAEELARARLEEIFHLQRMQTANELASVLAHEINQPLTAIPVYVTVTRRLLEESAADLAEISGALDRINSLSLQAGEIIRKMRQFYTRGSIDPAPIDLNAAVVSSISMMESTARRMNIRLSAQLRNHLPAAMGVNVHIEQVLLNLLRNAFDAIAAQGADGGDVTVLTALENGLARVTVRDSGPGIDAESAQHVFDILSSKKARGLGVGLRISRTLVEAQVMSQA